MKLEEISMTQPSKKMVDNFHRRTNEHIKNVQDCIAKLNPGPELQERAKTHDASKFGEVEYMPYIWITEFYRCKNNGIDFEYPPGMEEKTRIASKHHVTTNRHHPEYHDDISDMTDIDIIEMVCDWAAMAIELGEGSARGWADKNVGSRWKFTPEQTDLIYSTINKLDSHQ